MHIGPILRSEVGFCCLLTHLKKKDPLCSFDDKDLSIKPHADHEKFDTTCYMQVCSAGWRTHAKRFPACCSLLLLPIQYSRYNNPNSGEGAGQAYLLDYILYPVGLCVRRAIHVTSRIVSSLQYCCKNKYIYTLGRCAHNESRHLRVQ